jgi:hypothetical protein
MPHSPTELDRAQPALERPARGHRIAVVSDAGVEFGEPRGVELSGTVRPAGLIPAVGPPDQKTQMIDIELLHHVVRSNRYLGRGRKSILEA